MVDVKSLVGTKGAVVVFVANGCPTARAYEDRLNALADKARANGIAMVAVNSNNPALSPPDSAEEMSKRTYRFPYVKDSDGSLAKEFGAVCTPHAFLLDGDRQVLYAGRIDDSRLGDRITSTDLENAMGDLIAGRDVRVSRTEPFGCSIVW
jgi:thiol-disulfide isomerase/thioredoxin